MLGRRGAAPHLAAAAALCATIGMSLIWPCALATAQGVPPGCRETTPVLDVLNGTTISAAGPAALINFAARCPSRCPYAVRGINEVCDAQCVESPSACLEVNQRATLVLGSRLVCQNCPDPLCRKCSHSSGVDSMCEECFEGFTVSSRQCTLIYETYIVRAVVVLASILLVIIMVLIFTTWEVHRMMMRIANRVKGRIATPVTDPDTTVPLLGDHQHQEKLACDDEMTAISKQEVNLNLRTIDHAVYFVSCSSIMAGSRKGSVKKHVKKEVGVGLPLFYNTQKALIIVSLLFYLAMLLVKHQSEISGAATLVEDTEHEKCRTNNIVGVRSQVEQYARTMAWVCFALWGVLLLLSWGFARYQKYVVRRYDLSTASMEDYTVKLKNLPKNLTSESELMRVLERKLDMEGKIHGVSIVYDIQSAGSAEKVKDMIEHLVEYDDLETNWCIEQESTSREQLSNWLDEDKQTMHAMMEKERLQGSGKAYVVFERQRDVQIIMSTIHGIQWDPEGCPDEQQRGDIVIVESCDSEPTSLHWYNHNVPILKLKVALMFVRAFVLFAVFGLFTFVFYTTMIDPYTNIDLPPNRNDMGLQIVGNTVGLSNAAIQAFVLMETQSVGFKYFRHTEQVTFWLNTIVVTLNTAFQVMFVAWTGLITRDIRKLDNTALKLEYNFIDSFQTMLHPGLFFIQYFMNEVFTALAPSVINWLLLRLIYVWKLGPACFRRVLKELLPRPPLSLDTITGREAEWALNLPELLMSLEYTFVVVFPAATFAMLFFFTDTMDSAAFWLFAFAVFFYVYQRFANLWFIRKTTHDSDDCFVACIVGWGFALSLIPTAAVWWVWRLGLCGVPMGLILTFGAYIVSLLIYVVGLQRIGVFRRRLDEEDPEDPGFSAVMEERGYSWWNVNPIYVLKNRYWENEPGYELIDSNKCWPSQFSRRGFFENGKAFRHVPKAPRVGAN